MTINEVSEWRGWIWIAIFLFVTSVGGGLTLYERAQARTEISVTRLKMDLGEDIREIRSDVREIRSDVKLLLRERH